MIIAYDVVTHTMKAQASSPDEQAILDHIFSRADGLGLMTYHLSAFLNQRAVHKASEDSASMYQAFKALPLDQQQSIMKQLNLIKPSATS